MLLTFLLCGQVLSQTFFSLDVTEDYEIAISKDEENGSGRRLRETDYQPIRIAVHFVDINLPTEKDQYLKLSLTPTAQKWYESIVKVQRRTSNIVVSPATWISAAVPAEHRTTGVADADILIYVTVAALDAQYAAQGGACQIDLSHNFIPIVGNTEINSNYFPLLTNEASLHLIISQFAIILGCSSGLHPYYYNRDTGTTWVQSDIIATGNEPARGKTVKRIILPTVVEKARNQFACPTLEGVEVEGEGSWETDFQWDERLMHAEFMQMSIGNSYGTITYSEITFAVLYDSGWYEIEWDQTMDIRFGYKRGCDFIEQPCLVGGVAQWPEFCDDNSSARCDFMHFGYGTWKIQDHGSPLDAHFQYFSDPNQGGKSGHADYCPLVTISTDCRLACSGCRCVQYDNEPVCQVVQWVNDEVVVTIDGQDYTCQDGQTHSINGIIFECPPYEAICRDFVCLNNCGDHGECVDGLCICDDGWSGTDCNVECDPTCLQCRLQGSGNCTSCHEGAELTGSVPSSCTCSDGWFGTPESCSPCHQDCRQWPQFGDTYCTACFTGASLPTGLAEGTCTCDEIGWVGEDPSVCEPWDQTCETCAGASDTDCTTCHSTASLDSGLSIGACECPENFYDPNDCKAWDGSCKSCVGNTANDCTECFGSNTVVVGGAVGVCECKEGMYGPITDCQNCHAYCRSCINGTQIDCTACNTGAYPVNNGSDNECVWAAGRLGTPDFCQLDCSYDPLRYYNPNGDICDWLAPTQMTPYGTCETCARFINAMEILSSDYLPDFTGFQLIFNREMVAETQCVNIFEDATYSKLGIQPRCSWQTSKVLEVIFGENATLEEEKVTLKSNVMLATEGNWLFERDNLEPQLSFSHEKIKPTCDFSYRITDSLEVYASGVTGGLGRPLDFTWSVPGNTPVKETNISYKSQPYQSGNFTIFLTVENWLSEIATCQEDVLQLGDLYVEVTGNLTLYQSQARIYSASVTNRGSEDGTQYDYEFQFVNSTLSDPTYDDAYYAQVISVSRIDNELYIASNSLRSGHTYTFKVVATESLSQLTGTRYFTLTVVQTPIVAVIDRVDAFVSYQEDLQISARGSYDPDQLPGVLAYEWTCFQCIAGDGSPLISNGFNGILIVPAQRLKAGDTYVFKVKVTKDTRQDSKSVTCTVVGYEAPSIYIKNVPQRVNPHEILRIETQLSEATTDDVSFEWELASGPSLIFRTGMTFSYIVIEQYSMIEGEQYTMSLDASFDDGLPIALKVTFTANTAPQHGSISINPAVGKELDTDFELLASLWEDIDLPLRYSFYYSDIELVESQESNMLISKLPSGNHIISGLICDSLNTWVFSNTTAGVVPLDQEQIVEIGRNLDTYLNLQDPDSIPSFVSVFSNEVFKAEENRSIKVDATSKLIESLYAWAVAQQTFDQSLLDAALGSLEQISSIGIENENVGQIHLAIDSIINVSQALGVSQTKRIVDLMCNIPWGDGQQNIGQNLCDKYLSVTLPEEIPNVQSCDTFGMFGERKSARSMLPYGSQDSKFQVDIPEEGFDAVENQQTAVLDVCMIQYSCASTTRLLSDQCLSAPTLDISLNYVGTYEGSQVQYETSKPVQMSDWYNFTLPIEVTCANFTAECFSLDDAPVQTLYHTNGELLCATNGQGRFTARQLISVTDELIEESSDDDEECSLYMERLVPGYILFGIFLLTSVLMMILRQKAVSPEAGYRVEEDPGNEEPTHEQENANAFLTQIQTVDETGNSPYPIFSHKSIPTLEETLDETNTPKVPTDTQVAETQEDEAPLKSWVSLHFMLRIFYSGHNSTYVIALGSWLAYQMFTIGFIYFLWEGPDEFLDLHWFYVFIISVAVGIPIIFLMQLAENSLFMTLPIGIFGTIGVAVLSAYVCHIQWPIMFSVVSSFNLLILESIFARVKLLILKE